MAVGRGVRAVLVACKASGKLSCSQSLHREVPLLTLKAALHDRAAVRGAVLHTYLFVQAYMVFNRQALM